MAKIKRVEMDAGTSRIWNGQDFSGTAVVYAATPDDHTAFQCDFKLETQIETRPHEVRACRQTRKSRGKDVPQIRQDQLGHEVVLIFGPEMSANAAVMALKRLARQIEKTGLMAGRNESGEFVKEAIDREHTPLADMANS